MPAPILTYILWKKLLRRIAPFLTEHCVSSTTVKQGTEGEKDKFYKAEM